MAGKNVGYIRVSTTDQNTDRQLAGIELDRVFTDKCSGGSAKRPQLAELLDWVREDDIVHVHSMDRLARNLQDLRSLVDQVNAKEGTVKFHKENLEFSGDASPMSDLLLNLLGAVAQFERSLIKERQREGIQQAKKRGVYTGRKQTLSSQQQTELQQLSEAGKSKAAIARHFGVSRTTVYKYLKAEAS